MDSTSGNDKNDTKAQVFDIAYRINELNKIDQNIAKLLRSAGEAVQALTLDQNSSNETGDSIEDRKATFSKATTDYFAALSYVDVHLRRQIYALEEAHIIPIDVPKDMGTSAPGPPVGPRPIGNLDVGWLNSRNDKVGMDMQAELWTQAKEILDGVNLDDLFKKETKENGTSHTKEHMKTE